jgi:hypothetical protein
VIKKLVIAALFLLPPVAGATTPPIESAPRQYEIEVMVFQNIRPELEGGELWMNERINPEIKDLDKAITTPAPPREDSDLSKAKEVLEKDGNYRILVHKQWIQNADAPSDSPMMRMNTEDGELDGTFKFFMSRFLHVDLNLLFKEPESKSMFQADNPEGGNISFEIRDHRRVRSNEMYYFDHPKFGALVQVKQVETGGRKN